MILTQGELDALTQTRCHNPHQYLGMHRLGDGKGVVVRAFIPHATEAKAVPTHEKSKPVIPLKKIHESGVFEGVDTTAGGIYAYDLEVVDGGGAGYRTRDPYSFLPTLGESELFLFAQGNENRIYEKLGAQPRVIDGVPGTSFAVWAPNASRVSVVGDFNDWDGRRHALRLLGVSGVWEIFIPGVGEGSLYKYEIRDRQGAIFLKTDPFGFFFEGAPKNASIVWNIMKFSWSDGDWMSRRSKSKPLREPMSIYEVHIGSWRKKTGSESLGYRDLAAPLIDYTRKMGFTHVEFLPVSEHAFYPSWGYQVTGFYAPTSRYGTPDDFQALVNQLHEAGIGVIIDWVPAHFPRDEWALARFDGTALYEHEDPRKGAHQDWGTLIFNFGRHEVRNFLAANALFWCDRYHVDGLRVDAVASMLYLDYSRKAGEWIPNQHGGRENIEAVAFLQHFNHVVHTTFPGVVTVAEESTSWPLVTRPPYLGGLGFSFKWNMGWMHDTLKYFSRDPIYRQYHQNDLTFAMLYHHNENFLLPLSHDEVVHGKGSLIRKMTGDDWQKFANLRALLGYQWLFPGKKLLFMGDEFGQSAEWDHNGELQWQLLGQGPFHLGLQKYVADLNHIYRREPALWRGDFDHEGFQWVDCDDVKNSVLSFTRRLPGTNRHVLAILNLTPEPRLNYRIGLPTGGFWKELINSDSSVYGGSNMGNLGGIQAQQEPAHRLPFSGEFLLPPLSLTAFQSED